MPLLILFVAVYPVRIGFALLMLPVIGADGTVGGEVVDLWVDQAEMLFRYLEVKVPGLAHTVLLLGVSDARAAATARLAGLSGRISSCTRCRLRPSGSMRWSASIATAVGARPRPATSRPTQ